MAKQPSKRVLEPWDSWAARFLGIYATPRFSADTAVKERILSDPSIASICAVSVRHYVDKAFTQEMYAAKKQRAEQMRCNLRTAIAGMEAARDVYRSIAAPLLDGPTKDCALKYMSYAEFCEARSSELKSMIGRYKDVYNTKRHGRDRDHSFLEQLYRGLSSRIDTEITYAILADLINAGFETADSQEVVDEDVLRKNLSNYRNKNPELSRMITVDESTPNRVQAAVQHPSTHPQE
jgi:hypothetical protein